MEKPPNPWLVLFGYVALYDIIVIWMNRKRKSRGLVCKHRTLSAHARRLDERPVARLGLLASSVILVDHLLGKRFIDNVAVTLTDKAQTLVGQGE